MEYNEPWLTCRSKGRLYLLAKSEDAYFAIEVDEGLDYATEEWIQQQGVSEILLKELHLNYRYYAKTKIRGVAIGGTMAGDMISIYPQTGNRCDYTLELDYEVAAMESFFENIPRFMPPQKKEQNKDADWRKARQDPELFHKLSYVPAICTIANMCAVGGYIFTDHWLWFTFTLALLLLHLGLLICMPVYFVLALPKKSIKQKVLELQIPLIVLSFGMLICGEINWLSDHAFWIATAIGMIMGLVIFAFLVDLHQVKGAILGAVIFGALGGWFVIGHANQAYDFSEPEIYLLEAENVYKNSGRRHTDYYCVVTFPDGREVKLEISRAFYNELDIGDTVRVERSVGALGIEYANAYPLE